MGSISSGLQAKNKHTSRKGTLRGEREDTLKAIVKNSQFVMAICLGIGDCDGSVLLFISLSMLYAGSTTGLASFSHQISFPLFLSAVLYSSFEPFNGSLFFPIQSFHRSIVRVACSCFFLCIFLLPFDLYLGDFSAFFFSCSVLGGFFSAFKSSVCMFVVHVQCYTQYGSTIRAVHSFFSSCLLSFLLLIVILN